MGSRAIAICECGYSKSFNVGGARHNFQSQCDFPYYCDVCNDITIINVNGNEPSKFADTREQYHRPIKCRKCSNKNIIPYSDSRLIGVKGSYTIIWSEEHRLTTGLYKCPKCKGMNMQICNTGLMFD